MVETTKSSSSKVRTGNGSADDASGSDLQETRKELIKRVADLGEAANHALDVVEKKLRGQLRERPYTVLGAALASGFVLGGGLSLGLTGLLLRAGGRWAAATLVSRYVS